jgi:hypothetical protein
MAFMHRERIARIGIAAEAILAKLLRRAETNS